MSENTSSSPFTRPLVIVLCAMICCALWGSAYPSIKIGYRLFDIASDASASQILFAGIRFTMAGFLVLIFGSCMKKEIMLPRKEAAGPIFILAMTQTFIQYVFFYIAMAHTTGVKSSILTSISCFFSILIAALIFRQEKLTALKILGCLLGFAGVVIVNLSGGTFTFDFSLNGEGFLLLSSLCYSFSSVFMKKFSQRWDPLVLSGSQFILGGALMTGPGLILGGKMAALTPVSALLLLYMAFISAAAYSLWGILLKYNPVSRISVFTFLTPIFGVVLSALFLRESAQASGLITFLALVLICVGIYVVNRPPKKVS